MNNHYIPRLLLRKFAIDERVNSYNFEENKFTNKKTKNVFASKDIFDAELELAIAQKIEGPFADLLNHKILCNNIIRLNREENLLVRKFILINNLRNPVVNMTWDEMVVKTQLENHPSTIIKRFLSGESPEYKELFEKSIPSRDTYISNLWKAVEIDSLEQLSRDYKDESISPSLQNMANLVLCGVAAFWDTEEIEQEYILPKLIGINQMDYRGIMYKAGVLQEELIKISPLDIDYRIKAELMRLIFGSLTFSENFSVYPISPTRSLIFFSPYFRAFFPTIDYKKKEVICRPFLPKEQFGKHFFKAFRMNLFEPCENYENKLYTYRVKSLERDELFEINAMQLEMETEEFVFRDYNKIRDSFWYYDNVVKFALPRKHNFSHMI